MQITTPFLVYLMLASGARIYCLPNASRPNDSPSAVKLLATETNPFVLPNTMSVAAASKPGTTKATGLFQVGSASTPVLEQREKSSQVFKHQSMASRLELPKEELDQLSQPLRGRLVWLVRPVAGLLILAFGWYCPIPYPKTFWTVASFLLAAAVPFIGLPSPVASDESIKGAALASVILHYRTAMEETRVKILLPITVMVGFIFQWALGYLIGDSPDYQGLRTFSSWTCPPLAIALVSQVWVLMLRLRKAYMSARKRVRRAFRALTDIEQMDLEVNPPSRGEDRQYGYVQSMIHTLGSQDPPTEHQPS